MFPDVAQLSNVQCENCHGPNDTSLHANGTLDAARISIKQKLPMADSIMLATARRRANLRWTLEQADRVLVVGPRLVPIVKAWGAPEHSIRVVPNGFDKALVAAGQATGREPSGGRFEVLSVSNLVPGKGVDVNCALALIRREGIDAPRRRSASRRELLRLPTSSA
jgi:glycosyltransferase involved in cell wall biosynthesis